MMASKKKIILLLLLAYTAGAVRLGRQSRSGAILRDTGNRVSVLAADSADCKNIESYAKAEEFTNTRFLRMYLKNDCAFKGNTENTNLVSNANSKQALLDIFCEVVPVSRRSGCPGVQEGSVGGSLESDADASQVEKIQDDVDETGALSDSGAPEESPIQPGRDEAKEYLDEMEEIVSKSQGTLLESWLDETGFSSSKDTLMNGDLEVKELFDLTLLNTGELEKMGKMKPIQAKKFMSSATKGMLDLFAVLHKIGLQRLFIGISSDLGLTDLAGLSMVAPTDLAKCKGFGMTESEFERFSRMGNLMSWLIAVGVADLAVELVSRFGILEIEEIVMMTADFMIKMEMTQAECEAIQKSIEVVGWIVDHRFWGAVGLLGMLSGPPDYAQLLPDLSKRSAVTKDQLKSVGIDLHFQCEVTTVDHPSGHQTRTLTITDREDDTTNVDTCANVFIADAKRPDPNPNPDEHLTGWCVPGDANYNKDFSLWEKGRKAMLGHNMAHTDEWKVRLILKSGFLRKVAKAEQITRLFVHHKDSV